MFFEEYKQMDRLCADMYSGQNGVSEYLTEMEDKAPVGRFYVAGWDEDYRTLKHVRWVRNKLAHESDVDGIAEESDLRFVKQFHERLIQGQDPLTALQKAIAEEEKKKRAAAKKKAAAKKTAAAGAGDRKKPAGQSRGSASAQPRPRNTASAPARGRTRIPKEPPKRKRRLGWLPVLAALAILAYVIWKLYLQ